jgi:hypothetical protein
MVFARAVVMKEDMLLACEVEDHLHDREGAMPVFSTYLGTIESIKCRRVRKACGTHEARRQTFNFWDL